MLSCILCCVYILKLFQAKKSAQEFDKDDVLWDVLFKDDPEAEEISKKFWNILVPGKNADPNQVLVGRLETRAFKALNKLRRPDALADNPCVCKIQNKWIQVHRQHNFGV